MKNEHSQFTTAPDLPSNVSKPLLRLIRHSDPRDLQDSPSLSMTVERFKRRFAQRLRNNLHVAQAVIFDALVAEGYRQSAAAAETDRFARQLARTVADFQRDAENSAIAIEEIEQAQAGLASITPILPKGDAR